MNSQSVIDCVAILCTFSKNKQMHFIDVLQRTHNNNLESFIIYHVSISRQHLFALLQHPAFKRTIQRLPTVTSSFESRRFNVLRITCSVSCNLKFVVFFERKIVQFRSFTIGELFNLVPRSSPTRDLGTKLSALNGTRSSNTDSKILCIQLPVLPSHKKQRLF